MKIPAPWRPSNTKVSSGRCLRPIRCDLPPLVHFEFPSPDFDFCVCRLSSCFSIATRFRLWRVPTWVMLLVVPFLLFPSIPSNLFAFARPNSLFRCGSSSRCSPTLHLLASSPSRLRTARSPTPSLDATRRSSPCSSSKRKVLIQSRSLFNSVSCSKFSLVRILFLCFCPWRSSCPLFSILIRLFVCFVSLFFSSAISLCFTFPLLRRLR